MCSLFLAVISKRTAELHRVFNVGRRNPIGFCSKKNNNNNNNKMWLLNCLYATLRKKTIGKNTIKCITTKMPTGMLYRKIRYIVNRGINQRVPAE